MVKKCIYCGESISKESVIDFCEKCGKSVWGEKMFNTIVKNMEEARDKGDLCHHNMLVNSIEETPNLEKIGF